ALSHRGAPHRGVGEVQGHAPGRRHRHPDAVELVSRTRSSHDCSAGTFANFGSKRDTRIIDFLVSLWFGSSLRCKLRTMANFRTATLANFSEPRPPDPGPPQ